MKIKQARHIIWLYMKAMGFQGYASLWDTIYLMPGYENNRGLIAHEAMHLEQMKREGKVMFLLRYLGWTLRKGYYNNPYEIEAREAQRRAESFFGF